MDITERKKAEEEKTRLASQLRRRQKMEAIETLVQGIAHGFNNLPTSIIGQGNVSRQNFGTEPYAPPSKDGYS